MVILSAFLFALGGFLNACMDRSRDGHHEGSWLFERDWVKRFNVPATSFILGIVPWDFWHVAKWFMWLAFGFAHFTLRLGDGPAEWHVLGMLAQGVSFLFWYHAGFYRDPLRRLGVYAKNALKRLTDWLTDTAIETRQLSGKRHT